MRGFGGSRLFRSLAGATWNKRPVSCHRMWGSYHGYEYSQQQHGGSQLHMSHVIQSVSFHFRPGTSCASKVRFQSPNGEPRFGTLLKSHIPSTTGLKEYSVTETAPSRPRCPGKCLLRRQGYAVFLVLQCPYLELGYSSKRSSPAPAPLSVNSKLEVGGKGGGGRITFHLASSEGQTRGLW
jgi:hypothetical protein